MTAHSNYYLADVAVLCAGRGAAAQKGDTMPIKPREGSQEDIVLQHIRNRKITPLEAFEKYKITDLAGRIKRLEEKGWPISHTRARRMDKKGREESHWTEYRLIV